MRVEAPPPSVGGRLLHFRGQVQNPPADGAEALPDVISPAQSDGGPSPARVLARGRNVVPLAPRRPGAGPARRRLLVAGGTSQARVAITLFCAAMALVGVGTAAYIGLLNDGTHATQAQADLANADQAHAGPAIAAAPPTTAVAPEVQAPAAYRLCTAFDRSVQRGDDMAAAEAFRHLARAAGGAGRVAAYCATLPDAAGRP
ncbi:MAG TPA: hypothetical protein VFX53_14510 [Pedococcus sp.]|nr:hypothetical protein [Pedococcus sp.]